MPAWIPRSQERTRPSPASYFWVAGQLAKAPSKRRRLLVQEAPKKRCLPLNFALNLKLL